MTLLRLAITLLVLLTPAMASAQPQARSQPQAKRPPPRAAPAIVLVHGAWADGSSWDRIIPLLQAKGHDVVAVHLPLTSPAEDVAATTRAIERQPGDVVLVAHSYGGVVISRAGHHPKVKALVYVDAFALEDGESVNSLLKDNPPPWLKTLQADSGGFAWMPPATVKNDFAQDLNGAEQRLVHAKQGPVPLTGFDEQMKDPAWKKKPSWYVRGTADRIIDPAAQAMFAKRMKATTTSIDASHLGILSKPQPIARVILDAAGAPTAAASR